MGLERKMGTDNQLYETLVRISKNKIINQNKFKMRKSILLIILGLAFYSCQNMDNKEVDKQEDTSQIVEKDVLKLSDIIGDTLR
jgi:hypothetical protein